MSCSKPMYQPEKCDGQFCPGDCDCGCPLAKYWLEDEEDEEEKEKHTRRCARDLHLNGTPSGNKFQGGK